MGLETLNVDFDQIDFRYLLILQVVIHLNDFNVDKAIGEFVLIEAIVPPPVLGRREQAHCAGLGGGRCWYYFNVCELIGGDCLAEKSKVFGIGFEGKDLPLGPNRFTKDCSVQADIGTDVENRHFGATHTGKEIDLVFFVGTQRECSANDRVAGVEHHNRALAKDGLRDEHSDIGIRQLRKRLGFEDDGVNDFRDFQCGLRLKEEYTNRRSR